MTRRLKLTAAVTAAALFAAGVALAYINPGFTPVNLVEQADYILLLKVKPVGADKKFSAEVLKCLKGQDKAPKGPLTVDLSATAMEAHAESLTKEIAGSADAPVMCFVGKGEKEQEISFLHLGGKWYSLDKTAKAGVFEFNKRDDQMEGTWAGGTDMLLKITELLVKYPDTDVPVKSGVAWSEYTKLAPVTGKVWDTRAPDLEGKGELRIHLACDAGDRLYGYDKKAGKPVDETATRKLATKSRAALWADFDGDGRLDLASWDGQALGICAQAADGTFGAPVKVEAAPAGRCLGLAALDSATAGRPAILWSGEKGPVLLRPGKDGAFAAAALDLGKADLATLGEPGRCLVADLDDDTLPDALFPLSKGALLFRGKAGGEFAAAEPLDLHLGKPPCSAFVGDYDMDGRTDVFCVAEDGCRLWHNRAGKAPGEIRFESTIHISGEVAYISKPGGLWGNTCDVNNDGRQDVFFVYAEGPEQGPQIFFNRGFRSFGHGHEIDITERTTLERAETKGQQHGIVADLTGDGAQDMFVVLKNGDVYFFPRAAENQTPLCARAFLPTGGGLTGPVKVTAWNDRRCLGAWNVTAGTDEGFFGQLEPGELRFKWQLPGAKEVREAKLTLSDDKPVVRLNLKTGK